MGEKFCYQQISVLLFHACLRLHHHSDLRQAPPSCEGFHQPQDAAVTGHGVPERVIMHQTGHESIEMVLNQANAFRENALNGLGL